MREVQLTKGQKFVSKFYPTQKFAVVRGTESTDGTTWVVYERELKGLCIAPRRTIETIEKDVFLSEYKEMEDFFVSGGEYKIGSSTAYVKEVYTISNPVGPKYRKQARAIFINSAGKRYMEMLDGYSFTNAKRVK